MKRLWLWIPAVLISIVSIGVIVNVAFNIPKPDAVAALRVGHVRDAESALLGIQDGCGVTEAIVDRIAPDLVSVDVQITISPWIRGWIGNEGVFYGTLEEAVRALGGTEIAVDPQGIWFKTGPTTASSIWGLRTPLGRTVWMPKDSIELADCGA